MRTTAILLTAALLLACGKIEPQNAEESTASRPVLHYWVISPG